MTRDWTQEADDADVAEQLFPEEDEPALPGALADDAPEADAVEQQLEAGLDEDDRRD